MSKEEMREISIASKENLNSIIEYARRLHGHLGPFLVLGIKMSLAGMNRLGIENMRSMRVEAELPCRVPYTCTLDGIQATTQCTFGNQKLTLKKANSLSISAKFSLNNPKKQVIISLKNEILKDLMEKLKKTKEDEATQEKLAWIIAFTPEDKLFSIEVNNYFTK